MAKPNYIKAGNPLQETPLLKKFYRTLVYENIEKVEGLEIVNTEQQDLEQIKSLSKSIEQNSTEFDKETLTVQIFKSYLSKEYKPAKQKMWFELLDNFFPSKHDEITLDNLMDKLDSIPEIKDKLIKAKKDIVIIKSFFKQI